MPNRCVIDIDGTSIPSETKLIAFRNSAIVGDGRTSSLQLKTSGSSREINRIGKFSVEFIGHNISGVPFVS